MSRPHEQVIIDTLAGWLGGILTANGYFTSAGRNVFTDEGDLPEEPDAELLLVLDKSAQRLKGGKWTLTVVIEGLALLDPDDETRTLRERARQLVADIRRCLFEHRRTADLPAGTTEIRETLREIPRREGGSNLLTTSVTLEIDYSDLYKET